MTRTFVLAQSRVRRQTGSVLATMDGVTMPIPVMFAGATDAPVLGATALEILGFGVDPVEKKLVQRDLLAFQLMDTRRPVIRFAVICFLAAALTSSLLAGDASYRAAIEKWRQQHEASLKSDHGWLTVSGLFWLHEGENRFGSSPMNDIVLPEGETPAQAGVFEFHGGKTTVHVNPGVALSLGGKPVATAEIRPDSDDQLVIGNLTMLVHRSGDRYAIRLRDKNSKLRKDFSGLHWFPIDESYCVTAHYIPYDKPKQVAIQNILGDTSHTTVAGYVAFTLRGQEYRLEPEDADSDGMFFVFRDLTSGKETYPAARFLVTPPPKDGAVVLDFNQAYNPPCAYNPYTTCPLPSPENRLKARIEAGEMAYKHDHSS